jgi:spore coat protein U-like protein
MTAGLGPGGPHVKGYEMHIRLTNRKKTLIAAALLSAVAFPGVAMANSTSANLSVTATVTANCTVSTSPVAFGSFDALAGSAIDATGGVTVTCTNGTSWAAAAGAGSGTGATLASRKLSSGANLLNYSLFTDTGRTTLWGDGTATTATIANTGSGTAQAVTIYGRIAASQAAAPAGSYSDTVSVTITY